MRLIFYCIAAKLLVQYNLICVFYFCELIKFIEIVDLYQVVISVLEKVD